MHRQRGVGWDTVSDEQGANGNPAASDTASVIQYEQLAGLVHAFISMMHAGNMARMDLEFHDLRLSLRAHSDAATPAAVVQRVAGAPPVVVDSVSQTTAVTSDQHVVTAPMIGTFYASPAPNEPVFINPGDHVEEGQTIGIIEAMKIMNEIAADRSGTVAEIIARNAQPVEFGSPLVILAPDVP
jgi:acetyl-CoA carboxylase biotin carboxyl carrier protein